MDNKKTYSFYQPRGEIPVAVQKRMDEQSKIIEKQAAQIDYIAMMSDIDITGEDEEADNNA